MKPKNKLIQTLSTITVLVGLTLPVSAQELPDPDGKPADMSKPVQVYILLGQSNMLGAGKIKGDDGSLEHAVKEKKLYPYLVDKAGNWTERKDVRNVRVMGSGTGGMRGFNNEWMTIKGGKIGPEFGIGHHIGNAVAAPVLILKSCIGNRALGWDLLPPGGEGFEFTDAKGVTWIHPGYKGTPEKWVKGTEPKKIKWYAGMQYDFSRNSTSIIPGPRNMRSPAFSGGRVIGIAAAPRFPAGTRRTWFISSRHFARTSMRPRQSSSVLPLAKPRRMRLMVAVKS